MKFLHRILHNYYFIIYQDCLDENIKEKLSYKIKYHRSKLTS
ncbi:hypothetical protein [Bacillus kwashiorkori]|nr:hypothetical protein [Bacillus kwashiorkori]